MTRWEMAGGIVIVSAGILLIAPTYQGSNFPDLSKHSVTTARPQQIPIHTLNIVSTCLGDESRKVANVHLTNTGSTTIPSSTVMVIALFKDALGNELSTVNKLLRPQNMLPGATTSENFYYDGREAREATSCEIVTVNYGYGD